MLGRVVEHVAPLAQRLQVGRSVVPWVVVEMGTCQDDEGHPHGGEDEAVLHRDALASIGTPALRFRIPPPPVAEMGHTAKMRTSAPLTARAGTLETNRLRYLLPVDRVEPSVLRADRHDDSMSHASPERKYFFPLCLRFVARPFRLNRQAERMRA